MGAREWPGRETRAGRLALTGAAVVLCALLACRQGVPVIDTTPRRPDAPGTISGTVRGPEGTSSIDGRVVEVVNVATGERQQTTTNSAGGFTFKVVPGRYRVQVTLRDGERVLKEPGVLQVNTSDVDAHADFVIGSARAARPRSSAPDPSLAPPVA
jgi:hypothetical protein